MATTFEELIGGSRQSQSRERYDSFPSFDEYNNRNKVSANYSAPIHSLANDRSATSYENDNMKRYESVEYDSTFARENQNVNYNIYGMTQDQVANYRAQSAYIPAQRTNNFSQTKPVEEENKFYQYALTDIGVESRETYDRQLAYTHSSRVDDGVEVKERLSIFTPVKSEYKKSQSKRAKINAKGKVLFAVFFSIVVLVASLIVVNADKINSGTATTPSSSVSGVVSEVN